MDTAGAPGGINLYPSVAARLGIASAADLPRSLTVGAREIPLPAESSWAIMPESTDRSMHGLFKGFFGGQIGAGFLSRHVVCLDPASKRMGLMPPASIRVEAPRWIPMLLHSTINLAWYPSVPVRLGSGSRGSLHLLMLDTGSDFSVLKADPYRRVAALEAAGAEIARRNEVPLLVQDARFVTTSDTTAFMASALPPEGDLRAGAALFTEGVPSGFSWSDGLVGNDVLSHFRMLIDYARGRLWLERVDTPPDPSRSMVRVGAYVGFGPADGCPTVLRVPAGYARATSDALRVGDVLLESNGVDLCKMWRHEILTELAGQAGQLKRLKVRRQGVMTEVTVPVLDLLAP